MRDGSGSTRIALWQGAAYALSLILLAAIMLTWHVVGYVTTGVLILVAGAWLLTVAATYVPMRVALLGYAVLRQHLPEVEASMWIGAAFDAILALPTGLLAAWLLRDMQVVPLGPWVAAILSLAVAFFSISLPHHLWYLRTSPPNRAVDRRHRRGAILVLVLYAAAWLATALFGVPAVRRAEFPHVAKFQGGFTHQPIKAEQHNVVHSGFLGHGVASKHPPQPFLVLSRGLVPVPFIVITDWEVYDANSGGGGRSLWLWTIDRPRSLLDLWFWAAD